MFKKKGKLQEQVDDLDIVEFEAEEEENNLLDEMPTEKKVKKKLPGWVIIPIIGGIVLIGVVAGSFSKKTEGSGMALQTVEVKKDNIKQVYNTSGLVDSNQKKMFYSPVNAPILDNKAKVGKAVKAGDILVAFDTTNLDRDNQKSQLDALSTQYSNQDAVEQGNRASQAAAEAQASQAASVESIRNQVNQKQSELSSIDESINSKKATQQANKAIAQEKQNAVDAKTNELNTKKQELDQLVFDLTYGEYSESDRNAAVEKANTLQYQTIPALESEIAALQAEYAALMPDASGEEAGRAAKQGELDALKNALSEAQNGVKSAGNTGITSGQMNNMQVSQNLAELSKLSTEELLAKGREGVKAEFDGVIAEATGAEAGQATQGGVLFTLVSNKDVNVRLEVSANDFDNLQVGNKAVIKIGKNSYKGTVTSIDKIAVKKENGSPTIGADVRIDNPDEDIYIGVSAKVTMTVAEKKNVLCVPNEVVNTSTEGDFIYVIKKGVVEKEQVKLGVSSNTKVEVISGIKEGEQVVSDTSGELKEGMKATGIKSAESVSGKE